MMRRNILVTLMCGLLVCDATSCVTWRAVASPDAPGAAPRSTRVTRKDGTQVLIIDAIIRGDSIVGGNGRTGPSGRDVAVPLRDVARIEEQRTDVLLTALTVGVLIGAIVLSLGVALSKARWLGT